jgi:hypothetical protein
MASRPQRGQIARTAAANCLGNRIGPQSAHNPMNPQNRYNLKPGLSGVSRQVSAQRIWREACFP